MFKGDYGVLMGVRVECPALLAKIYSLQFMTRLGLWRVTPLDTIKGLLVQVFSTRGWFGQR